MFTDRAEMPDLASIVTTLNGAGFKTPGYQTEFLDGRRVTGQSADDVVLMPAVKTTACEAGGTGIEVDPARALTQAESAILRTRYDEAGRWLEQARAQLPCLQSPIASEQLFRIYFLQGITAYFTSQTLPAQAAFEQAQAVAPEQKWDRSYPPGAWEVFLAAKSALSERPQVEVRTAMAEGEAQVWIDGVTLGAASVRVSPGEHLVQVARGGAAGTDRTFLAWLVKIEPEPGSPTLWITDGLTLRTWSALFEPEESTPAKQLLVDVVAHWARGDKRGWALLVSSETGDESPRVVYLDATKGALGAPPDWMVKESSAPQMIEVPTLRGPRKMAVPKALHGWQVSGGLSLFQQLGGEGARYAGIELGGIRKIRGSIDAQVAVGLGGITGAPTFNVHFYQALHVGVRKTWMAEPFGAFVEGGFLGCRCKNVASAGIEARGGSYYHLDPQGLNALELVVGIGAVFGDAVILGQAVLSYQRAF